MNLSDRESYLFKKSRFETVDLQGFGRGLYGDSIDLGGGFPPLISGWLLIS